MNPPFSEGRWEAHLVAAADLVNPHGGRLVAVLPMNAKGKVKDLLPGWRLNWSTPSKTHQKGDMYTLFFLI